GGYDFIATWNSLPPDVHHPALKVSTHWGEGPLSLQMNMAAALGVQLIYTTGNMEDRVLATFPLCIRLRNDADQRTGIRHLHIIDRIVGETAPDEDGITGRVSAARLLVKPRELDAMPNASEEVQQESYDEMGDDR
ncbi:hypothetical protein, partial [Streptosporangium sp. NPDC004631]